MNMRRFFFIAPMLSLVGVLAVGEVSARAGPEEFGKAYAYCGSSAVFVGVATKVYFRDRPDMSSCEDPTPKTVEQFADQGMICYPLIAEVEVKEYLFTEEERPRTKFKLHMKWASPEFRADSIEKMGQRLRTSSYIYSVRFMKAYEDDGVTWLMGYPRSVDEHEYVRGAGKVPPCSR
ncbi:hypothetical protein WG899_11455 [Paucibacter sp. AS339]|uniref:hypothetical protein n=1 Tax=Paucibacter hankyongi TaxID=3133434 RepID=UPI0030AA9E42